MCQESMTKASLDLNKCSSSGKGNQSEEEDESDYGSCQTLKPRSRASKAPTMRRKWSEAEFEENMCQESMTKASLDLNKRSSSRKDNQSDGEEDESDYGSSQTLKPRSRTLKAPTVQRKWPEAKFEEKICQASMTKASLDLNKCSSSRKRNLSDEEDESDYGSSQTLKPRSRASKAPTLQRKWPEAKLEEKMCHENMTKASLDSNKCSSRKRNETDEEEEDESDYGSSQTLKPRSRASKAPTVQRKWFQEEIEILRIAFNEFLQGNELPGWDDVYDAQTQFPLLKKRTKETIKARFVHLKQTGH
jgi:hypothetical protein